MSRSTGFCVRAVLSVAFAALLSAPHLGWAATISLGTAKSFAVLGAATVTNVGSTTITGDVGVYPGTAITGMGGISITGAYHQTDVVAQQAQIDSRSLFINLAALPCTTNLSGSDLGTVGTLSPGVYCFNTSAQLTGTLTLDALADPAALFVFQIGTTLTTASASVVNVLNGGANNGIYFQVGSSATLGSSTVFAGNIIADQSISLDSTAKILCGRAIALVGQVSMITNTISNDCSVDNGGTGRSDSGSTGFSGEASAPVAVPAPGVVCPEQPAINAFMTQCVVDSTKWPADCAVRCPGFLPWCWPTLDDAVNAVPAPWEPGTGFFKRVIGVFGPTLESAANHNQAFPPLSACVASATHDNVVIDRAGPPPSPFCSIFYPLRIEECHNAKITAGDPSLPVIDIKPFAGNVTINGIEVIGGAVGILVENSGTAAQPGSILKAIRAEQNHGGEPVNLTQLLNAQLTLSVSSFFPGFPATRAVDDNLNTSWFTAVGDLSPSFEIVFPQDVTVSQVQMFGNREFPVGNDFLTGTFKLLDAGGVVLFDSGVVTLLAPNGDVTLAINDVAKVRRVRFTGTTWEGVEPGFAELKVFGFPPGSSGAGIEITGNRNEVSGSFAEFNDIGFKISGNDNLIKSDRATCNLGDGFDVSGTLNILTGNDACGNAANPAGEWEYDVDPGNGDGGGNTRCGTLIHLPGQIPRTVPACFFPVTNKAPVAVLKANPPKGKVGSVVAFNGCSSTDADGAIASYAFDFGDGTSTITSPATCSVTHAYSTVGKFKACLVVTDDGGAASKPACATVETLANKAPTANFDRSQIQPYSLHTMKFTDLSKDSDGRIVAWAWTFGDGTGSTNQNPTHTYAKAGTFAVTLTVTDDNGATSKKTASVGVK